MKPLELRVFFAVLPAFLLLGSISTSLGAQTDAGKTSVDLSGAQNASIDSNSGTGAGMKQWFDRIDLSGFVNAGYVKTGGNGNEPNGHFYAGERLFGANLFIDANIDDGILAHNELLFYNQTIDLDELYIEFKDPLKTGGLLSLKVGRIDIPYGDEYLWQSAIDNPMILRTAEWPWGFSQGVEVFGHAEGWTWVSSVMDGLGFGGGEGGFPFDRDDSTGKMVNLKLNYDPTDWVHLSASAMDGGPHASSAMILNGINIAPVGSAGGPSVLGISHNSMVDFQAWQADARLRFGQTVQLRGDFGNVFINDTDAYARQLTYYYGEAKVNITPDFYLVGRYSAIGTFDNGKGYMFGGDYDGAASFGYDLKSFSRVGCAVGYWLSNNTVWKAEVDNDTLALIDPAVGVDPDPGNNRYTVATEVVVKF
jgi:hypothetical protein